MSSNNSLENIIETLAEMKDGEKKAARVREIVPIEEWVNSTYYCPDADAIYPYWKNHIINIFNSPIRINEVIFTGSLGTGKTTIANILLLRRLYELSCYTNIPALFNLMGSSKLMFAYFNLNLQQAELTGFGQIREMIDRCPYFQEHFPRDTKNSAAIKFPQANMLIRFASNTNHTIGTNLIGSVLDEANFYTKDTKQSEMTTEVQNKAKSIYTAIRNRRKVKIYGWRRESFIVYISIFFNV